MTNTTPFDFIKAKSYALLAAVAGCDHLTATQMGYRNGWEMLLDRHDGPEMASFCTALASTLSQAESQVLLDRLAQDYGHCRDWPHFVDVCCEHPGWLPVRSGGLPKVRETGAA